MSISVQHGRAAIPSPRRWLHLVHAHAVEHDCQQHTPRLAHRPWDQPAPAGIVATEMPEVFAFLACEIGLFPREKDRAAVGGAVITDVSLNMVKRGDSYQ